MMAVWDVLLPTSVAKPTTIFLSMVAVREGVRSWLMMMHFSVSFPRSSPSSRPMRLSRMREVTSRMSEARSRRYSSSRALSVAAYLSATCLKAYSAVDLLVHDPPGDFLDERGVFEHEQMRVEDAGVVGAESLVDLALHVEDLLARLGQGLFEAANLFGQFLLRKITRNTVSF